MPLVPERFWRFRFHALVTVVVMAAVVVALGLGLSSPLATKGRPEVVRVRPGESAGAVAQELQDRHLIKSALAFRLIGEFTGASARLEHGVYLVSPAMSPSAILRMMAEGRVATRTVTIPEGFTVDAIANRLGTSHITSTASFLAAVRAFSNPYLPAGAKVLDPAEGYLFPSTYRIPYGTSAKGVLGLLFATFRAKVPPSLLAQGKAVGLTPNGVVTLASIVEKEAGSARDLPIVAAVFENRMKKDMPLGSDATLVYALGVTGGNLTVSDLQSPTPYNTLHTPGLPPGPIASPGLAAIEAVLHPSRVTYLYFFSLPDGTDVFSNTYAEQVAAEKKYGLIK